MSRDSTTSDCLRVINIAVKQDLAPPAIALRTFRALLVRHPL